MNNESANETARRLAAKHAHGSLSPEEEQLLFRTAAQDQDVFNELMEEEVFRLALRDPASRADIERALRQSLQPAPASQWQRILGWLARPQGLAAAGAFAALLVVGMVILQKPGGGPQPIGITPGGSVTPSLAPATISPKAIEATLAADLFSLPIEGSGTIDLQDLASAYRVGGEFRIRVTLNSDANLVIVQQSPGGAYSRLFPNQFHESPRVSAGEELTIPPAGQGGWTMSPPAGKYRLRIVALPESVDPLAAGPLDKEALRGKIAVVEKTFVVED